MNTEHKVNKEKRMRRVEMRRIKVGLVLFLLFLTRTNNGYTQNVALKTNALYDAATSINIGAEVRLGSKVTLDLPVSYNPWTFSDDKKLKHILAQPEVRLWQCESFNKGFIGVHGIYSYYNAGGIKLPMDIWQELKNNRYQGWLLGTGISYGRQWLLSSHWSLEATAGAGYVYTKYKQYDHGNCGSFKGQGNKNYLGPTKVGLTLIYLFREGKGNPANSTKFYY